MGVSLKLTGQWKEALDCIDPIKFRLRVQAKIQKILEGHAKRVLAKAREMSGLEANKPLTVFVKGRNEPGVDSGKLKSAIRIVKFGKLKLWIGVPAKSPEYKKAVSMASGAIIPVTDEMRMMFRMLWAVSEGQATPESLRGRAADLWKQRPGGWYPLKEETTHIVIVQRNFMAEAWRDCQLAYNLESQIRKAVQTALTAPLRGKRK